MSAFICADCMEYLPKYDDGFFDLAITDPPYGGGSVQTQETDLAASAVDSVNVSTNTLRGGTIRCLLKT